jgi:nitrogen fixation/metabolism regulation signal transduction histidine kinase
MDRLIRVYNRMIEQLREERTRLREQHYFMDKILAVTPAGVLTFDFDGRIALANPSAERLLQLPAASLTGKTLQSLGSPFTDALAELSIGESAVMPLHGSRRIRCLKANFLDQGFTREFITMEELTEELRLSEKAAYEKLIRMMSHEVNNSVGAVRSLLMSSMNYQDQLSSEDREDFSNAMAVAVSRVENLSEFMSRFSQVVRLPEPDKRPCDLHALLRDLETLLEPWSREAKVQWVWNVEELPPPILLDKNQLEQVFLNVFKNAIEAIGDSGTIGVRLGRREERYFVTIEDSGADLAPEVRQNLFTPFFSTKKNGQGIGLILIREILARHGFEFSLDCPPGGPTQFVVYF